MVDRISPIARSRNMARISSKNTAPEVLVRRLIWQMGLRYRLHVNHLPGKPDIVFPKKKKIILVHGCFWHMHTDCAGWRFPKSQQDYWVQKLQKNKRRDEINLKELNSLGWEVLVIWECEMKDRSQLAHRIEAFVGTQLGHPLPTHI